jgi:hypothetical protein
MAPHFCGFYNLYATLSAAFGMARLIRSSNPPTPEQTDNMLKASKSTFSL